MLAQGDEVMVMDFGLAKPGIYARTIPSIPLILKPLLFGKGVLNAQREKIK